MKVGIIGCGRIAQTRHIPEYETNAETDIWGFYDLNRERAETLAYRHGGKAYLSIDEMLADSEIEAVSVCTANDRHAEITIRALESGKHVLCEKPMATTFTDCEAMVKAAEKNGKKLVIGQNQRLAEAHVKAKELIKSGTIGKILTFKTTFGHGGPETWSIDGGKNTWFFDSKRATMGAMADLGIHKTDLIQYLTGMNIVKTMAVITTLDKCDTQGTFIGVDDNAICIYTLENGIVGTMTASWTYYGKEDNSAIIYGTEGIMKIYDDNEHALVVIDKDGKKTDYDFAQMQTNDNQTNSGIIDMFVDTIKGTACNAVTGDSVLNAMRAVFASIESSKLKKEVTLR